MKVLLVPVLLLSAIVMAQTPATIKSSPAADALVQASKDYNTEKASFDTSLQQARSSLDQNQKDLQKQLTDLQKELGDQLKADKKYKPMLDKIESLQKQVTDLSTTAQREFDQKVGPIATKMNSDKGLIDGLIPIVRKENNLPDNATYDPATQKWTTPAETKK